MLKDGQLLESMFIHFSFLLDLIEFVLWERDAVSGPILMSAQGGSELSPNRGRCPRVRRSLSRSAHEYTSFKVMWAVIHLTNILIWYMLYTNQINTS